MAKYLTEGGYCDVAAEFIPSAILGIIRRVGPTRHKNLLADLVTLLLKNVSKLAAGIRPL